jgi:hypothetical protein
MTDAELRQVVQSETAKHNAALILQLDALGLLQPEPSEES